VDSEKSNNKIASHPSFIHCSVEFSSSYNSKMALVNVTNMVCVCKVCRECRYDCFGFHSLTHSLATYVLLLLLLPNHPMHTHTHTPQTVLDNPTCFLNPFQFEITFECLQELEDGTVSKSTIQNKTQFLQPFP
jgi:hypothetical protein